MELKGIRMRPESWTKGLEIKNKSSDTLQQTFLYQPISLWPKTAGSTPFYSFSAPFQSQYRPARPLDGTWQSLSWWFPRKFEILLCNLVSSQPFRSLPSSTRTRVDFSAPIWDYIHHQNNVCQCMGYEKRGWKLTHCRDREFRKCQSEQNRYAKEKLWCQRCYWPCWSKIAKASSALMTCSIKDVVSEKRNKPTLTSDKKEGKDISQNMIWNCRYSKTICARDWLLILWADLSK